MEISSIDVDPGKDLNLLIRPTEEEMSDCTRRFVRVSTCNAVPDIFQNEDQNMLLARSQEANKVASDIALSAGENRTTVQKEMGESD